MMVMDSPNASTSPKAFQSTATFTTGSCSDTLANQLGPPDRSASSPASPCATPSAQDALRLKFFRANALVASVLNKFHNGSRRAVDPFVIGCLQEEETRLFSLQCFIEQGPAEKSRARKESAALSSASQTTQSQTTLLSRLFGLCGGYMGGPGSIMRQWDAISCDDNASGLEDALCEYISIVDRVLPGWDRPLPHEFPIAQQDKFWKDDLGVDQCQSCGACFTSVHCRRHHCRMCLDIFCSACCTEFIDMALCPGAPIRRQRVCVQCFEDAEKDRSLLHVRRVIRDNHELEQRIKEIGTATEAHLLLRQREETKLRIEAEQCGCDLREIDAQILQQIGSPVAVGAAVAVQLPPAHKFTPRESADANEQLTLAHRQLQMALKVAQCRAKKAVEKMEITLRVLREAICFGSTSTWNVVLRHAGPLFTLREIYTLLGVSHTMRRGLERYKSEAACVLSQDLPSPQWRAFLWQAQWLKNDETRQYITDLADAIRTRMESSDSEGDDGEQGDVEGDSMAPVQPPPNKMNHGAVATCHALLSAHVSPNRRSVWKTVYEYILARCDDYTSASSCGEFDAQIQGDVSRTFGVSSLRRRQSLPKTGGAAMMSHRKAYQRAGASTLETPLALRKTALTNVLRAFASVNSEIGYCQGMDHVTAILLSVVDWNESDAFWMLTSLVASPTLELDKLYGPGLPHLTMRVYQLEQLLALHLPELYAHLQEMEFPVSMITTTWFMTLFTNMDALSYDLALRVLDGFFVCGWKSIFRVALALMEALQHHMLASSFEEMPQVLYDIHTIAPLFAGAETDAVLASAARFKVTNRQLQTLALQFEKSGGVVVAISSTVRNGSQRSTASGSIRTAVSPMAVKTPATATPATPAANGPPRAASPTAPLTNGRTNGTHGDDKNHSSAVSKHDSSPSPPAHEIENHHIHHQQQQQQQERSPPKLAAHELNHTPSTSHHSRNSRSSSSNSSESTPLDSDSGYKSPDKPRAASPPPAFRGVPQHHTPQSSHGLATPLNANYFF